MAKKRWWVAAVGVLIAGLLCGCGGDQSVVTSDVSVAETDLDVFLDSAQLRGGRGAISVEPLPVGTLHDGATVMSRVLVEATDRVPMGALIRFEGTAKRVGGGARLGVAGTCGLGWTDQGRQIEGVQCEMLHSTLPGDEDVGDRPTWVWVTLYPRTESGPVTAGTYRITVPLDKETGARLKLTYRIVESGEADLPDWPDETVPWTVTFEPGTPWWLFRVRIEDAYGRVVEERELAQYRDELPINLERDGVFTTDVPRGVPLRVVFQLKEHGSWVTCDTESFMISETRKGPTALVPTKCAT